MQHPPAMIAIRSSLSLEALPLFPGPSCAGGAFRGARNSGTAGSGRYRGGIRASRTIRGPEDRPLFLMPVCPRASDVAAKSVAARNGEEGRGFTTGSSRLVSVLARADCNRLLKKAQRMSSQRHRMPFGIPKASRYSLTRQFREIAPHLRTDAAVTRECLATSPLAGPSLQPSTMRRTSRRRGGLRATRQHRQLVLLLRGHVERVGGASGRQGGACHSSLRLDPVRLKLAAVYQGVEQFPRPLRACPPLQGRQVVVLRFDQGQRLFGAGDLVQRRPDAGWW
jgi:hypothetical protein